MKEIDVKVFENLEKLQNEMLRSDNQKDRIDLYIQIKQIQEQIKQGYALKDTLVFTYQTALANFIKEQEQTIRELKKHHDKEIKNIYKTLDKA